MGAKQSSRTLYALAAGLLGTCVGVFYSMPAIPRALPDFWATDLAYVYSALLLFPTAILLMGDPSVPLLSIPRLVTIGLNGFLYAGVLALVRRLMRRYAATRA
jgi:hypothetical protein